MGAVCGEFEVEVKPLAVSAAQRRQRPVADTCRNIV